MRIMRDLRFALRSLLRSRGFTATAVVTLAVGITFFTTAVVVLKAYLLTGLPYPAAERLYWVRYAQPNQDAPQRMETLDWPSLSDAIEHPIAWDLDMFYLPGGEYAESAPGAWVTEGFVRGLGIQPAIGRGFDANAFVAGGPNVALISHRLWTTRFGGDSAVIGRTFTAYVSDRPDEAETFSIIGVMPPSFWHINAYTDILAPLRASTYPYMVRLRPGLSRAAAAARITALVRSSSASLPREWSVRLESVREMHVSQVRRQLVTASIAAGLVLLVGCGNVAGLLLVRWARRQREIAVRTALGAGYGAIARMLVAEGTVIAAAATVLGGFASSALLGWLAPLAQQQLGRAAPGGADAFSIDIHVIAFAAAVGTATAVLCSLVPMIGLLRPSLLTLHAGSRGATDGPRSRIVRNALVTLEIAVSLALLSAASLMLRSVGEMLRVNVGYNTEQLLTASVTLRQARYPDAPAWSRVFDRMLAALESTPGVETAGLTNMYPLQQPSSVTIAAARPGGASARAPLHSVSTEYFEVLEIPLNAGRRFARSDRAESEAVAIVSETLSRRLGLGADAVGSYVDITGGADRGGSIPVRRRVIGIARDVRQGLADEDLADAYVPIAQVPTRFGFLIMKASVPPVEALQPVRATLRQVDPELALDRVRPFDSLVDALMVRPRFMTTLLGALALAAVVVAVVGLYGVIAYSARQREREVAVRLAVGAAPRQIVALFVRDGARLMSAGLAAGLVLTILTTRLIESELFGVSPRDPLALSGAALALALAALAAIWYPARRAAVTDPAIALRSD